MDSGYELVLVINSGSSSLKFSVIPAIGGKPLVSGLAECLGLPDARLAVKSPRAKTGEFAARRRA